MTDPEKTATPLTVVGYGDISERLGIDRRTPHQWATRGLLPPPDFVINRQTNPTPAWYWSTILQWLRDTNRSGLLHGRPKGGAEA